jgi:hypothetical protein
VLTAYSQTRPPVDDPEYRHAIENPMLEMGTGRASGTHGSGTQAGGTLGATGSASAGSGITPERQERIDELREALAEGTRWDQIEEFACREFGLSQRAARDAVLLLIDQLEADGERIRQGTHEMQSLTLALRRRERLVEMAAKQKDEPLLRDLEIDRCKLLGLYAKDRREKPSASGEEEMDGTAERMIEVEFARLDLKRGHRHTVAELIADKKGQPSVPGREPFRSPLPADWDPDSPYPSLENDDWLTEDLGPDWDDTLREDDYDYVPPPAASGEGPPTASGEGPPGSGKPPANSVEAPT